MHKPSFAVFALSTFFATVAFAGTLVGHPIPTCSGQADGIVWSWGQLPVSTVVYDHCGAPDETVDYDETLDPVANDLLVLTPGYHCGVTVNLDGRYILAGQGVAGGHVGLSLGVGTIHLEFDPPVFVPTNGSSGGTGIRLADPNWITAAMIDLDDGETIVIGANHALHDTLRDAVRYDSTAW
jgi:hypothetical protein